jgi:hypothetical protein
MGYVALAKMVQTVPPQKPLIEPSAMHEMPLGICLVMVFSCSGRSSKVRDTRGRMDTQGT